MSKVPKEGRSLAVFQKWSKGDLARTFGLRKIVAFVRSCVEIIRESFISVISFTSLAKYLLNVSILLWVFCMPGIIVNAFCIILNAFCVFSK